MYRGPISYDWSNAVTSHFTVSVRIDRFAGKPSPITGPNGIESAETTCAQWFKRPTNSDCMKVHWCHLQIWSKAPTTKKGVHRGMVGRVTSFDATLDANVLIPITLATRSCGSPKKGSSVLI